MAEETIFTRTFDIQQMMNYKELTNFSFYPEYAIRCRSATASPKAVKYFLEYKLTGFVHSAENSLKYLGNDVISCGVPDLAAFFRLMTGRSTSEHLFGFCDDGCEICIDGYPNPIEASMVERGILKLDHVHYKMGGGAYPYLDLPKSILVNVTAMPMLMGNLYTNLKNLAHSFSLLDLDHTYKEFIAEYEAAK